MICRRLLSVCISVAALITVSLAQSADEAIAQTTVTPVALSGQHASGLPSGVTFGRLHSLVAVNNSGQVAFGADLAGDGVTTANDRSFWMGTAADVRLIAREGSPAVAAGPGVMFASPITAQNSFDGDASTINLNQLGEMSFFTGLSGPGVDSTNNQALWIARPGNVNLIARTGNAAPGMPADVVFSWLRPTTILGDDGSVAFYASLAGPGVHSENDWGLWLRQPNGNLSLVAREGDPAPGTSAGVTFGSFQRFNDAFYRLALNAVGQLAFMANLRGSVDNNTDAGIWLKGADGSKLVAIEGQQAPGAPPDSAFTFTFNSSETTIGGPSLNSAGEVAFRSRLIGPGVAPDTSEGIWVGTPSELTLAAREGDAAPGTNSVFASLRDPRLNAAGDIAFSGDVVTPDGLGGNGIWTTIPDGLRLIARQEQLAPASDGLRYAGFGQGNINLNPDGHVVYLAGIAPSGGIATTTGIWLDIDGEQTLIARGNGTLLNRALSSISSLEATGGDDGMPVQLNDLGQVAFVANFLDGGSAVFVSAPENIPGDFNGDDKIDAADYVVWRKGFATGAYSHNDYNVWRSNFGATAAGAVAVAAVPEPSLLALVAPAIAMIILLLRGRQRAKLRLAPLLFAISAALSAADRAHAQQPFFMGLGDLPGGAFFSWATDVSYDGSVVTGYSFRDEGNNNVIDRADAFRWTRATGMVGLGALGDYFPDVRISADGSTIVGNIGKQESGDFPFRWTAETGRGSVGLGYAYGVNGDGSVVVGITQPSGNNQAVILTQAGGAAPLFIGLSPTWAFDISADGSVILGQHGGSFAAGGSYLIGTAEQIAFIEHGPGISSTLGQPKISDNGQVVVGSFGMSQPDDGRAFRWTKETGVTYLDLLPDGKRTVTARGVSADGSIIVGNSEVDVDNILVLPGGIAVAREPFIWDAAHGPRYLFDVLRNEYGLAEALTGWGDLGNVWSISGDGRTIVGLGVNPDGNGEAWIAFLGPPAPPLSGDCNGDGRVDAADYVVWRKGFPTGTFTQNDYNSWRSNFGKTAAGAGAVAAVPEPNLPMGAVVAVIVVVGQLRIIRWRDRFRRMMLFLVIAFALTNPARSFAQQPFFMGLGRLPGEFSNLPSDVSYDGSVVVGRSDQSDPNGSIVSAYRWTGELGMVSLASPGSGPRASFDGSTLAWTENHSGVNHAIRWMPSTGALAIASDYVVTDVSGDGSTILLWANGRGGLAGPNHRD